MKTFFQCIVLGLGIISLAWGSAAPDPLEEYRQGAGARASGLGGAFVAVADDATAGYWNPAGLSQMNLYIYQAAMQYGFLPYEMNQSFVSYAFLWPHVGNCAVSWWHSSIGPDVPKDGEGVPLASANQAEDSLLLSYGQKVYSWVKGLSLGATLKLQRESFLEQASATGAGLDLGALWQPVLFWDHTLGATVQNLAQTMYGSNGRCESVPVMVKIGTALKFLRSSDVMYFNHVISTMDFEFTEPTQARARFGTEVWFEQDLGIRAGYAKDQASIGASYRPENYELDYVFTYDLAHTLGNQHRLSILLRFTTAPGTGGDRVHSLKSTLMPESAEGTMPKVEDKDLQYRSDMAIENIFARLVEVQKFGGRVSHVILDKGADDNVQVGLKGVLQDRHGVPLAVFTVRQVEVNQCLVQIDGFSREIDHKVHAVIKRPLVSN